MKWTAQLGSAAVVVFLAFTSTVTVGREPAYAAITAPFRWRRAGSGGEAGEWWVNEIERRRRQFILAHHPDRGGDAAAFMAGMRAFGTRQAPGDLPPTVVVVRHRGWLTRLVTAAPRCLHRGRRPSRVR
jgi:hypothetical protein